LLGREVQLAAAQLSHPEDQQRLRLTLGVAGRSPLLTMVRIAWAQALSLVSEEETLQQLSVLAETLIVAARFSSPPPSFPIPRISSGCG
jgi:glutamine synthetase adenylyltransferase